MTDAEPEIVTRLAERELAFYENLDLVLAEMPEAYRDHLWLVVLKLTGSDPAVFKAARRWLKTHDPAKHSMPAVATVESVSTEKDAGRGDQ